MKEKTRCDWGNVRKANMLKYHDKEWGVVVHNDRKLYEFLVLETAQAGLNWQTILDKRLGYKKLFSDFDYNKVAKYTQKDFNRLIKDPSIIRNKLKIKSAINNAQKVIEIRKEFGTFDKYLWGFVGNKPIKHKNKTIQDFQAQSTESQNMSKDMKKRGFLFVGPITMYAFMQAIGMVNDHFTNCFRYKEI